MSNASTAGGGPSLDEVVLAYTDAQFKSYIAFAAGALLLFDILITFKYEAKYVWARIPRLGSIFYLLARYGSLTLMVLYIAQYTGIFQGPISVCTAVNNAILLSSLTAAMGVYGLVLATTFTITRTNPFCIMALCFLALSNIGIVSGFLKFTACTEEPTDTPIAFEILRKVNAGISILIDAAVTAIVVAHTWSLYQKRKRNASSNYSLVTLLVRGGAFRFLILFIWNLAVATTGQMIRPTLLGFDAPMQNVISTILMCRFYILLSKIQEQINEAMDSQGDWTTQITEPHDFASKIGLTVFDHIGDARRPPEEVMVWEIGDSEETIQEEYRRRRSSFFGGDLESQYGDEKKLYSEESPSQVPGLRPPPGVLQSHQPPTFRSVEFSRSQHASSTGTGNL